MTRLVTLFAAGLLLTACGSHTTSPVPENPSKFELPPTNFHGSLPGTPVESAAGADGYIDPTTIHELISTGTAGRRVSLYVARGRHGELCVGTAGRFKCLRWYDAEPVYAFTVFAGHSENIDWGAIVGLVQSGVRVTLDFQSSDVNRRSLRFKRFPGFPWIAFASGVHGPNGDLPNELHVYDGHHDLSGSDLGFFYDPCWNDPNLCPPVWRFASYVFDTPRDDPAVEYDALLTKAKKIALTDRFVRKLLAGHRVLIDPPTPWYKGIGGLIGAEIDVHVAPPTTYEEDWPVRECTPHSAYAEGVAHYRVTDVTQLAIDVDVWREKVVGVDGTYTSLVDGPEPQFDQSSYRVVREATPAGGGDEVSCEVEPD